MNLDDRLEQLRKQGEARTEDAAASAARTERLLATVRAEAQAGSPASAGGRKYRLPRRWFRRAPTAADRALNAAIVVCFLVGAALVLKTPFEYYMRDRTREKLLNAFETGGFIEVPADAWEIPGEGDESSVAQTVGTTRPTGTTAGTTESTTAEPSPTGYTPPATEAYKPPTIVLQAIGRIAIPRIDKEGDPVLEGATDVNLRYGIGWYPPSAPIGSDGRTVLLGHKMKYYGVYFSRLYEMQIGDPFTITTADTVYTYRVTDITSVYKDDLMNQIFAPAEGKQCMLVTCDFRTDPEGNNRFLVHSVLESATPR